MKKIKKNFSKLLNYTTTFLLNKKNNNKIQKSHVETINKLYLPSKKLYNTKYNKLYEKLKKGQLILSVNKLSITKLLIPGEFTHISFCVSKDINAELHSIYINGYTKESFKNLCLNSTRITIIECLDFTDKYIEKYIEEIQKYKEYDYNYNLKKNTDNIVCSDLILKADIDKKIKMPIGNNFLKNNMYIPDAFLKASNINIVADSDKL